MNKSLKNYYLQNMGIPVWQEKQQKADDPRLNWEILESQVKQCQQCSLSQTRTQAVFGVGNQQAKLMLVGEAPGFYEDKQGEPFVGAAGQLLNKMLVAIGLTRQEVYIANVLKCRPPQNRDPKIEEVKTCTPFLEQQVQLVKPKILLALGRISAQYLLGKELPMYQLRGYQFKFGEDNIPLIVTYHPAYLLRNPKDKSKSYQDLLTVKGLLDKA